MVENEIDRAMSADKKSMLFMALFIPSPLLTFDADTIAKSIRAISSHSNSEWQMRGLKGVGKLGLSCIGYSDEIDKTLKVCSNPLNINAQVALGGI
jgi:hypothetical protein